MRPAVPERLVLEEARFEALPGWREDDHAAALAALRRSCAALAASPPETPLGGDPRLALTAGDLAAACAGIAQTPADDARAFLEAHFIPFRVKNDDRGQGLFTGYYEPELIGRRAPGNGFTAPVLARPADLVSVDLGRFREDWRGERIAGRVQDGWLVPYADAAAIRAGAVDADSHAIVWLRDPVEVFFLQIQGSGRVRLAEGPEAGRVIRVAYAGQNGHPYTAIGRVLIARGEIAREDMSMAAIRQWLHDHPEAADEVMDANASYVFFAEQPVTNPELGPPGAQGVLLTPGRSLAVDRRHHALGLPMWVSLAQPGPIAEKAPFNRLWIAQDTGGAIRGPVRGDLFIGTGAAAGEIAGALQQPGALWVLLPEVAAQRARQAAW